MNGVGGLQVSYGIVNFFFLISQGDDRCVCTNTLLHYCS